MKVVFSERAYVSVLAETAEKIRTETGGVFLGYIDGDCWYIVEAVDPGPKSVFQVAFFEYDQSYLNHLVNKLARLYETPPGLIGLWHRHPGSFDSFSGTDDGTNTRYARMRKEGAVSMLVNIDPAFRMTVYHVTLPLRYRKVEYEVGDRFIPEKYRALAPAERLLNYIDGYACGGARRKKFPEEPLFAEVLCILRRTSLNVEDYIRGDMLRRERAELFVEELLGKLEDDLEYFSGAGAEAEISLDEYCLHLCVRGRESYDLSFYRIQYRDELYFIFRFDGCSFVYTGGLFTLLMADAKTAAKNGGAVDKELVECSLSKLEKN